LKNKGELEETPKRKGPEVIGPRKGRGSTKKYFKKHQATKAKKYLKKHQTTKAREVSKSKRTHKL
jgi:hypothetical protein